VWSAVSGGSTLGIRPFPRRRNCPLERNITATGTLKKKKSGGNQFTAKSGDIKFQRGNRKKGGGVTEV